MPAINYSAHAAWNACVGIAAFLAACGTPPDMKKSLQDGVALVRKDYEEAKPYITTSDLEKCQKAFDEANSSITLLVRYKLTSPFLPSKTLSCLSSKRFMPQQQPIDTARYISYGAEITATSGLILKSTPNIYLCHFKVENGAVSLESSGIVSRVQKYSPCEFVHDPVQLSY